MMIQTKSSQDKRQFAQNQINNKNIKMEEFKRGSYSFDFDGASKHYFVIDNFKKKCEHFSTMVLEGSITNTDPLFYKFLAFQLQTPYEERTETEKLALCKIIKDYHLLRELNPNLKIIYIQQQLTNILKIQRYSSKEVVYQANQNDDNFYIVLKGKINMVQSKNIVFLDLKSSYNKIFVDKIDCNNSEIKIENQILEREEGNIKSKLAYALEESFLLKINHQEFKKIQQSQTDTQNDYKLLKRCNFFSYFTKHELKQLLAASNEIQYPSGCYIYKRRQLASKIFYLKEGEVILKIDQEIQNKQNYNINNHSMRSNLLISTLSSQTLFGEYQCLKNLTRRNSALVVSSSALIYCFEISEIEKILKSRNQNLQIFKQKMYHEVVSRKQRWRQNKIKELKLKTLENTCLLSNKKDHTNKSIQANEGMSNSTHNMKRYIHNSSEITDKLKNNSFIINLQNKYMINKPISFINPLFIRKDFPELETCLRRYENEEKRIKTKLSLPKLL